MDTLISTTIGIALVIAVIAGVTGGRTANTKRGLESSVDFGDGGGGWFDTSDCDGDGGGGDCGGGDGGD